MELIERPNFLNKLLSTQGTPGITDWDGVKVIAIARWLMGLEDCF